MGKACKNRQRNPDRVQRGRRDVNGEKISELIKKGYKSQIANGPEHLCELPGEPKSGLGIIIGQLNGFLVTRQVDPQDWNTSLIARDLSNRTSLYRRIRSSRKLHRKRLHATRTLPLVPKQTRWLLPPPESKVHHEEGSGEERDESLIESSDSPVVKEAVIEPARTVGVSESICETPVAKERRSAVSPRRERGECDQTAPRNDLRRECEELTTLRFRDSFRETCVRPFNDETTSLWEHTEEWRSFIDLASALVDDPRSSRETGSSVSAPISDDEKRQLKDNFFRIASAIRLKYPYLLVNIETGLESKRDLFEFQKFRKTYWTDLCSTLTMGLRNRDWRWCELELRKFTFPERITNMRISVDDTIRRLFLGYGPSWLTLSNLTGMCGEQIQRRLQVIFHLDSTPVTMAGWLTLHRELLERFSRDSAGEEEDQGESVRHFAIFSRD